MAEAARNGTHIGERLVGTLRQVRADWAEKVTARAGSAAWSMLDLLLRQPVVTARVVVRELGVSAPTAQAALQRLVEDGVLLESTGHRRNRVYRAPAVLRALDAYADGSRSSDALTNSIAAQSNSPIIDIMQSVWACVPAPIASAPGRAHSERPRDDLDPDRLDPLGLAHRARRWRRP